MIDSGNEVHRDIGTKTIAAGEAQTAIIRCRYDASIDEVWNAGTDPEHIKRWFLPLSGDLKEGGNFQIEGNAHGEILECDPPKLLRLSWSYWEREPDEVELRLAPGPDGGTILELEHASIYSTIESDPNGGLTGVGVGWEFPLSFALSAYLRGEFPEDLSPETFEFTPEIEAIVKQSEEAWTAAVEKATRP